MYTSPYQTVLVITDGVLEHVSTAQITRHLVKKKPHVLQELHACPLVRE